MIELHFNELLPSIYFNVYELLYTNVCLVIMVMWNMTVKFFISILSIDRWMKRSIEISFEKKSIDTCIERKRIEKEEVYDIKTPF